jgi:hypothetical protein
MKKLTNYQLDEIGYMLACMLAEKSKYTHLSKLDFFKQIENFLQKKINAVIKEQHTRED